MTLFGPLLNRTLKSLLPYKGIWAQTPQKGVKKGTPFLTIFDQNGSKMDPIFDPFWDHQMASPSVICKGFGLKPVPKMAQKWVSFLAKMGYFGPLFDPLWLKMTPKNGHVFGSKTPTTGL